jgi:hypothetical protein
MLNLLTFLNESNFSEYEYEQVEILLNELISHLENYEDGLRDKRDSTDCERDWYNVDYHVSQAEHKTRSARTLLSILECLKKDLGLYGLHT